MSILLNRFGTWVSISRWPFVLLLAAHCAWILSLPSFPTHDGPMHLYYIGVLHHLLAGKSVFSDFYSIRTNPIPPYTLQYVILFLLTSVVGFIAAEKAMV